jgi:nucleoside phosphorylase
LPIMRPRFVLVCGIGGSLDPKSVGYGNVVFGTSIDWKGFDKIETTKDGHLEFRRKDIHPYVLPPEFKNVFNQFKNRMVSKGVCKDQLRFDISPEMMDAFHTWAAAQAEPKKPKKTPDGSYNIIPGKIVSWDYVLNSQEERDRLYREDTSQICIEMESGAISYATDIFNTDHSIHPCTLFVFRGISDLAAQKVDTPWRDFAAHAAAKFTFEFYRSLDPIHFAMR